MTKVLAIGGGTGLPIVLKSLLTFVPAVTAVATVADDGGSSGRLREELGILPPGDSRNCLLALADGNRLAEIFNYRFTRGEGLAGHNLGNLLLAALTEMTGDFTQALDRAGRLLGARGRVLPPTAESITLWAELESGSRVEGQCNVANRLQPLKALGISPADARACPETVAAIRQADYLVIGPGSLFTSVMPNLLVRGIRDAVAAAKARRIFICNTATQPGETDGFSAADHVEALQRHVGAGIVDTVVTNVTPFPESARARLAERKVFPVAVDEERLSGLGVRHVAAPVADAAHPSHHDLQGLARVLRGLM